MRRSLRRHLLATRSAPLRLLAQALITGRELLAASA
jgi:hypothetical protein